MEAAESQDSRQEQLSAKTGTALNPFLPYIGMHGKVSRSFFLFSIDHIVATICQFVEIHLHRPSDTFAILQSKAYPSGTPAENAPIKW